MTNKKMSGAEKAGIGAGVAAAAAAAALGAYFLYGKHGTENRRKVKGWMLKARGEILERLEELQDVSEDSYDKIVKSVIANYKGVKNVTGPELLELAANAKKHWQKIRPMFKKGKAKTGKNGSRSAGKSGAKKRSVKKSS